MYCNSSHLSRFLLLQMLESSGFLLMADSEQTGAARVQMILEFLHERQMDFEDLSEIRRIRLEQMIQLCHFQADANQVLTWMRNGESMLTASFHVPTSLSEAEELQVQHEQFQLAIEVSVLFTTIFCFSKNQFNGMLWFNLFLTNYSA